MTGRRPTTNSSADGRSPAASALWDPDGAPSPVPRRCSGPAFFDPSRPVAQLIYRASLARCAIPAALV
jgi:hypothetical protein